MDYYLLPYDKASYVWGGKHKQILIARLFGDLSFEEIGEKSGITAKQAENVYFYIITKLRKALEGKRDKF